MTIPPERPDLSSVPEDVRAYIEELEAQLAAMAPRSRAPASTESMEAATTRQIVTISGGGRIKRTPRHLYGRQGRGGMGVFDIDLPEEDSPALLATADLSKTLLILTRDGRAYRLPVAALEEQPVRARGQELARLIPLGSHDRVVAALPEGGGQTLALVSQRGWVRRVRSAYLGPSMIPGTTFHDQKEGGPLVSACWTSGQDYLFIATRDGKAIRFSEAQVPARGCLGIRLDPADMAVAITSVGDDGEVFLLGQDGRGTIREMAGFAANRSPGAGGKLAMKTEQLVAAAVVDAPADVVIVSRLSKVIRFDSASVPPKGGVVQGVNCMNLRADEAAAALVMEIDSDDISEENNPGV